MRHFAVFGTHPRLSLAEFKAWSRTQATPHTVAQTALFDDPNWNGASLMDNLGGVVKLGDIVQDKIPEASCTADLLADLIVSFDLPDRILYGCTVFGGSPSQQNRLARIARDLKRSLKERGRSSRWVTGEHGSPLSPAAVAKLELTTKGVDLVLIVEGQSIHIGRTTHVQNADAWSTRDYGRPVRDDENGMLPPKLARMMVNLAHVRDGGILLDPFCGSGTVLMEAALATNAARIIGSDHSNEQIRGAQTNLLWLATEGVITKTRADACELHVADARTLNEQQLHARVIDAVVTEGYLGPPLRGNESQPRLDRNAKEITTLWEDTYRALHPLLAKDATLVCVWPAFKTTGGMARVDLTSFIESSGLYSIVNPLASWDDTRSPLLYQRAGQRVQRRIVVLRRESLT